MLHEMIGKRKNAGWYHSFEDYKKEKFWKKMLPLKTNDKFLPTRLSPSSGDQNWGTWEEIGRVVEGCCYDGVDMKQK